MINLRRQGRSVRGRVCRMNVKGRSVAIALGIVTILLASVQIPVRAETNEEVAFHIYDLARALYDENTGVESFTGWVNGDIGASHTGVPTKLKPGQPMPDFSFKVFRGQGEVTRKQLEGPYILNFWASWCPPCRDEFPLIIESIDNGDLTVPVIFVDVFDNKADAQRFLKPFPADLTIVTDDTKSTHAKKFGMNAIPQTVLVDADGNIQAIHTGGLTDLTIAFFKAISEHPGLGGFNSDDPDQPPEDMPTGTSDTNTSTE
jgi:thiol-disulfide isomerase/thioredoxin